MSQFKDPILELIIARNDEQLLRDYLKRPRHTNGRRVNMVGHKPGAYGLLTVLYFAGSDIHGQSRWRVLCACGRSALVTGGHLRNGNSRSCGCAAAPQRRAFMNEINEKRRASK